MCFSVPKVLLMALFQHVTCLQLAGSSAMATEPNGTFEGNTPKTNRSSVAAVTAPLVAPPPRLVRQVEKGSHIISDVNEGTSLTVVTVQSDGMTTPAPKLTRSINMREEEKVVRAPAANDEVSLVPRQLIRHYTVTQSVNDPLAVVHTSMVAPVPLAQQLGRNPMSSNPLLQSGSVVRANDPAEAIIPQRPEAVERQLIRHATVDVGDGQLLYSKVTYAPSGEALHIQEHSDGAVASLEVSGNAMDPSAHFAQEASVAQHREELLPLWLAFILAALAFSGFVLGLWFWTPHPLHDPEMKTSQSPGDIKRNTADPQCALLQKALYDIKEDGGYGSAEALKRISEKRGGTLAQMQQAWFKSQRQPDQKDAINKPISRSYETQSATEAPATPKYIHGTMIETIIKNDGISATLEEQELRAKALSEELQQGRL